jgi:2-polyprenyl-6-methoxyphenol hydroxylase-like FAD-dependent oxidoreductase
MTSEDVWPVLIVGGGPVGLALAGDLGWRGQRAVLIEQTEGRIVHPKMDNVNARTMEFCRRWGIAETVRQCPYPRDHKQDVVYLTSLTGHELAREPLPSMNEERPPPYSPEMRWRCPQDMFDPILKEFAGSMPGVSLRYGAKLVGLRQGAEGVEAEVEDVAGGAPSIIRARYIAACDGASSTVRKLLNIPMHGKPVLTHTTNIIFRCEDLPALHDKKQGYRFIFVGAEGVWATIVAINGRERWRMSIVGSAKQKPLSAEDVHAAIRRAYGGAFHYEILSAEPWVRRELVADNFREGCAFLLGDAAHIMSPTGGLGMNTGIADAVDLSWKLTAMLEGWGGPLLLDSYESERRPVALRNVSEASVNLNAMLSAERNEAIGDDSAEGARVRERVGRTLADAMRKEWYQAGLVFGYRYDDSPICWNEGVSPAEPWDRHSYAQIVRPGARAPHAWLEDGRSTLDLFGRGFVLLRMGDDAPDASPLVEAARARGVPLFLMDLHEASVVAAYDKRLVLMRPDGHVAWCDDAPPRDALAVIDRVRGDNK